jgi:sugar phosphate isomerase/epimerase
MSLTGPHGQEVRLAVVAEAFVDWTLPELLDWLTEAAPQVSAVELGSGGYAPQPHCDRRKLLSHPGALRSWRSELEQRGFTLAALNAWGNPLHPDRELAQRHDRELRETIRLAAALGVNRVVALAGCPPGASGDHTPHFAAGGWLPYLEGIYDEQWERAVAPYWSALSEFAAREHPGVLICIELHPGTAVYNVETFQRLAGLGPNLAANIDPSHFFWQQMDTAAVVGALHERIGHVHAKDVTFNAEVLARNGLLDRRWSGSSSVVPWKFATVGHGHDRAWWGQLMRQIQGSAVTAVAIEHEDPDHPARAGVPEAAALLGDALDRARAAPAAGSPRETPVGVKGGRP